jgi:hypothetical protein
MGNNMLIYYHNFLFFSFFFAYSQLFQAPYSHSYCKSVIIISRNSHRDEQSLLFLSNRALNLAVSVNWSSRKIHPSKVLPSMYVSAQCTQEWAQRFCLVLFEVKNGPLSLDKAANFCPRIHATFVHVPCT